MKGSLGWTSRRGASKSKQLLICEKIDIVGGINCLCNAINLVGHWCKCKDIIAIHRKEPIYTWLPASQLRIILDIVYPNVPLLVSTTKKYSSKRASHQARAM